MNSLTRWMANTTPAEQRKLARLAKTTLGTLRQIAGEYRGPPRVTSDLAMRIEHASAGAIHREDLSPACGKCEFAKRCRRKS